MPAEEKNFLFVIFFDEIDKLPPFGLVSALKVLGFAYTTTNALPVVAGNFVKSFTKGLSASNIAHKPHIRPFMDLSQFFELLHKGYEVMPPGTPPREP